jgi:hypothetical protein
MSEKNGDLRSAILAADDLSLMPVNVPEWGLVIYIATMTVKEREAFEARHIVDKVKWARERLIVATACDKDRNLLFTEADIDALSAKNAKACDRLFQAALELNAMGRDDIADLKKSSSTTRSDDSSSS